MYKFINSYLFNSILLVILLATIALFIDIGVGLANIEVDGKIAVTYPFIYILSIGSFSSLPQLWLWHVYKKELKGFQLVLFLWILALTRVTVNNLIWDPVWIYFFDMKTHFPEPLWGSLFWGNRAEENCIISQQNFALLNFIQGAITLVVAIFLIKFYDRIKFKASKRVYFLLAIIGWFLINYIG